MTQPHWTAIFLGSGGVVGGIVGAVTLVTNRLIVASPRRKTQKQRNTESISGSSTEYGGRSLQ
jgi:hypothetical protein